MKLFILALALFSLGAIGRPLEFEGTFANTSTQGTTACDSVFGELKYHTKLFVLSSTGSKAVLYFEHADAKGHFHGLSATGRVSMNEFEVMKTYWVDKTSYRLFATGLVSSEILLGNVWVSILDDAGTPLCTAFGEYTGFAS